MDMRVKIKAFRSGLNSLLSRKEPFKEGLLAFNKEEAAGGTYGYRPSRGKRGCIKQTANVP